MLQLYLSSPAPALERRSVPPPSHHATELPFQLMRGRSSAPEWQSGSRRRRNGPISEPGEGVRAGAAHHDPAPAGLPRIGVWTGGPEAGQTGGLAEWSGQRTPVERVES